MRIYVASSWRNTRQEEVVSRLRKQDHEVYDFKNPKEGSGGFHWSEIDPDWKSWGVSQFRRGLDHPLAWRGYTIDMDALKQSGVVVLVLPCGRGAHLEAGWAVGAGKRLFILADDSEPELMYRMATAIVDNLSDLVAVLEGVE
ncbi:hypothetical protein LCGC14_1506530 [marine sediment metagenome]|uniref:Nucleoside 2-deoxyribosyltransferase n=1 Tax=marine sediment metagenome TaxID=412755 RepID=A0A0F9M3Y3_9ZZZZ